MSDPNPKAELEDFKEQVRAETITEVLDIVRDLRETNPLNQDYIRALDDLIEELPDF